MPRLLERMVWPCQTSDVASNPLYSLSLNLSTPPFFVIPRCMMLFTIQMDAFLSGDHISSVLAREFFSLIRDSVDCIPI